MKRFQLTIVFVLFSALTIGAGAAAVNSLTASSAERSLISLTEAQSERDAHFIATLVSQLLAEQDPVEPMSPELFSAPSELVPSSTFNSTTLQINAPSVLRAMNIADLAIYDLAGEMVWTSSVDSPAEIRISSYSLGMARAGATTSGIVEKAAILPDGQDAPSDLVVTFVPLIGETTNDPVWVLGVSRPVPAGVATLLSETRGTVLRTTLISLSGVFLILLAFVLAADIRIWRRNELTLAMEREQQEMLGRRNQELRNLDTSRNRFLSAITHELSNPLTPVVVLLSVLARNTTGNLSEKQVDQVNTALKNSQQISRLVDDLRHVAQSSNGKLEIITEQFEVRPMLDEAVNSLAPALEARRHEVVLDAERDLGNLVGDRGRLIQVISNLLSNASKYSPEGSKISMAAGVGSGRFSFEISDEGIGISEEDLEHIFDMYWRSDNRLTQSVPGAGIGLVLARQIVEGHGGRIQVNSRLGSGTTVKFEVPMEARSALDAEEVDDEQAGEEPGDEGWERAA